MSLEVINVVGLGYIGLPTAIALAVGGVNVIGTDIDESLIRKLKNGQLDSEEPGLQDFFRCAIEQGIKFSTSCKNAQIYIISVPTPFDDSNKRINPEYILSALNSVLNVCENGAVIVIESTVSPGTIDKFVKPQIQRKGFRVGIDIHLAHAPERIIPGKMLEELSHNPRTIGVDSAEIGEKIKNVYSKFCNAKIIVTDIRTAEMTKVVENAYRDINIAYANELAKICREDNLNVYDIIDIANCHPRVNILQPGPGVGGHCISVDPWFLVGDYPDLTNIILAARKVNDSMPEYVINRMSKIMGDHGIQSIDKVGIYGLTYKEDVDDIRLSPAIQLVDNLEKHLAFGIKTYDPYLSKKVFNNQYFDFEDFLSEIEMIVILVAHKHLREYMHLLHDKIVYDTKNVCTIGTVYKL